MPDQAEEVPESAPRDGAAGVAALMALPAGTVVCFVDAAGPLAVQRHDSGKQPRWVLRPTTCLGAAACPGPTAAQLPALPADCLFVMQRSGERVSFRSLGAEGRTLQAVSGGGEHQLVNWNLGPWESWSPHTEHGLVNAQWGAPLGMGLAVVHAALAADVREASRRAQRDLRQLRTAVQTAQQRSTEMERQVALADAAARAEAGKGWAALQAKLTSTDAARAAAARSLAEQAAALEGAERRRSRAEAAAAKAEGAAASAASRERAAAAKLAEVDKRHVAAVSRLEDRLKEKEAALAAAEAERAQLVAALRDAVHAAKKAAARAEELPRQQQREAKPAAPPVPVPAPPPAADDVALGSIAEAEDASADVAPQRAAAAAPPKPPPSARKGAAAAAAAAAAAPRERSTNWPAPSPHPVWCASPATMPLSRYGDAKPVGTTGAHAAKDAPLARVAAAAPPAARTPPRAVALAAVADAAPPSTGGSPSRSASQSAASAAESCDSSQLHHGGGEALCRTPGSARKRLDAAMLVHVPDAHAAAMASVGPARAELRFAASATRPSSYREAAAAAAPPREERPRVGRYDRVEAPRREERHAERERDVAARGVAKREGAKERPREGLPAASVTSLPQLLATAPAAAKERHVTHHHAQRAAAAPQQQPDHANSKDDDTLPGLEPPPRAPLGRRSVNDMFLGLWEPSKGGATPSVPRRAAMQAQPRLAGWLPHGDAGEAFDE